MGWLTVVCECGSLICLRQLSEWKMLGLLRLLVLPLFAGNVMLSAHICLSVQRRGWGGAGGDVGVGWCVLGVWAPRAASVFFLSLLTLVFLPVCH